MMTTQKFIETLETIIDTWSGETIEPEKLLSKIKENVPAESIQSFIKHYGDCCLECALNNYFESAQDYKKVDGTDTP